MLSILGLGASHPTSIIDNRTLARHLGLPESFAAEAEAATGVRSRATVLGEDYLKTAAEFNPIESYKAITQTPTSLFHAAANEALNMAGVKAEEIGLIIGDTSTPYETTPSEGQRLGKALGISRVPAYDAVGNSIAFPLHLATLLKWREERIPDRLIIGSANTPTQAADFRRGVDAWSFGDAACAAVVSSRQAGILKVLAADYVIDTTRSQDFAEPIYGAFKVNLAGVKSFVSEKLSKVVSELKSRDLIDGAAFAAPPDYLGVEAINSLVGLGFSRERISYPSETLGGSLGSSPGLALRAILPRLSKGDRAVVFAGGPGLSFGYVVVEAERSL